MTAHFIKYWVMSSWCLRLSLTVKNLTNMLGPIIISFSAVVFEIQIFDFDRKIAANFLPTLDKFIL